jgi:UPF0716 protein FxsA
VWLFLIFVVVPITEIWLLISVGSEIGVWWTLGVVVATAMIGTHFVRHQGLATLRRAQQSMQRGVTPAREIVDGVMILSAGLFLLTPGFVTDAVGFALLMPPVRFALRGGLIRRFQTSMPQEPEMIDVDFQVVTPEPVVLEENTSDESDAD